ncbi:hypothetical protein CEXT_29561 [Caerostris extrusa]|uniref:Uncharacterized protein n=1 Tax=Caerostris extrusa TaxID=172846 RepID=A0AAV4XX50_CAEEX|nr:hypothetical protein CEXT_29561 [Caerostris extrusa]
MTCPVHLRRAGVDEKDDLSLDKVKRKGFLKLEDSNKFANFPLSQQSMDDGHRGRPGPVVVRIADTTVDVLVPTLLHRTEVGTAPVKTSPLPTVPVDFARLPHRKKKKERYCEEDMVWMIVIATFVHTPPPPPSKLFEALEGVGGERSERVILGRE